MISQQLLPLSKAGYDQSLADEITLLVGQINAANYRLIKLIATFDDFDDREAWIGGAPFAPVPTG